MGLLDGLAGQVLGSLAGPAGGARGGVVEAIAGMISNHPGGLAGLISEFERGGLGAVAASWVSPGANLPISPDQLQSVLGGQQLKDIAASLGLSHQDTAAHLSALLPQVIDQLTPNGTVPPKDALGGLLAALGR